MVQRLKYFFFFFDLNQKVSLCFFLFFFLTSKNISTTEIPPFFPLTKQMISFDAFDQLLALNAVGIPTHQLPFVRAMIILFGFPILLTLLRSLISVITGGSTSQEQYNALVKTLLRDDEKKKKLEEAGKNNNNNSSNTSSSFNSISEALHGQRDESVRQFSRLLTYKLVEQAANGRSDYEFHFRSWDFWVQFKTIDGIFTIPTFSSFWDCVDSSGSRDVIKEILEGRDAVADKDDEDDEDKQGNKKNDDDDQQQNAASVNSAQYNSPFYYSSLHQASVRQHYKKHEEETKKHSSQNGLRVDWSVAANYGNRFNPFAPKWILSCKWDRVDLTRAREFGGR